MEELASFAIKLSLKVKHASNLYLDYFQLQLYTLQIAFYKDVDMNLKLSEIKAAQL